MSDLNSLLPILWGGFCTTLAIFALTLLFSIPLGLLVAVLKMSRYRIIRYPVSFYISVMRGTPLLLQIVAIYFGSYYLSEYTGVEFSFDRFPAVIVIPKGQYEAAAMLGLTRGQTFYRIILPQVVKRVVPASANEVITLVKDTSLAQVIAVTELFALAKKQQAAYASIYPLFVAGVFYYIANLLLSVVFAYVERKLNYYK